MHGHTTDLRTADWSDDLDAGATVVDIVSRLAAAHPELPALRDGRQALTYGELEEATDRLAHHLRSIGVREETCVAVAAYRSVEALVAFVGVLKAGGAFVPVDPDDPTARLEFMLHDTDTRVVICQPELSARMAEFGRPLVAIGPDLAVPAGDPHVERRGATTTRSLAYVMYTSGSTGRPKGVAIEHRNIVARVRGAARIMPRLGEAVLQVSELDFDANTWEIWGALLNGAGLVIAPPGRPEPSVIGELLEVADVRVALLSPGLFHQMVESEVKALSGLRLLLVGGDVMSPMHARRFIDSNPGCPLINLYGPTEVTVCCTWYEVVPLPPGASVPIGRPLGNTTLHVLDDNGAPVPPGETGELLVGGAAVGRGYLNLPGPTAERFVPDPSSSNDEARLYRSGDLVRVRDDGDLDFIGRIDNQVKIRGFRIEPGEIEAALHGIDGVRRAAVIAREDLPGHKRLVAYVVCDEPEIEVEAIRAALAARSPAHLVPSSFVVLPELPLTARGKVDTAALPAPAGAGRDRRPPSTATETEIARVWADVLHLEELGVDDDFIELGGDSLLAIRILAGVEEAFAVSLPVGAVLEARTIAGLAQRVDESRHGSPALRLPPLVRSTGPGPLPVTRAQAIACLASEIAIDALPYQFQAVIHFVGSFDHAVLDRALTEIVRRHEVLRTRFPERDGRWVQVIEAPFDVHTPLADLTSDPDPDAAWQARAQQAYRERIPIDRLPLVRWSVLRVRPDHHVLVHVEHHLVHDGWSWSLLLGEIAAHYRAFAAGQPPPLPPLPVQYQDFTRWQEAVCDDPVGTAQLAYWRRILTDLPPPLRLPADRPRPLDQTHRGEQLSIDLDPALVAGMRSLAREQGVTMFMLMLAAYDAWLHRVTGQGDLVVGSGVANRGVAATEHLIGMVLNTVAIRVNVTDDPTVEDLLHRLRDATLGAVDHQDVPFERIVEAVQPRRRPGELPVYQTLFSFQDPVLPDLTLDDLVMEPDDTPSNGSAKADLNVVVLNRRWAHADCRPPGADMTVLWEYATDLFDRSTAERMLHGYVAVLEGIVADPGARLSALPLLEPADQGPAGDGTGAHRPYEREASIPEVFAARVAEQPEAIALVAGTEQWTYRELHTWSRSVAARLGRAGVGAGDAIAVVADRGPAAIVALLGALEAGGAYAALDPSHPPARLTELLATSGAAAVCADRRHEPLARRLAGGRPVVVVEETPDRPEHATGGQRPAVAATDVAYIAFTSGSTGGPKGVAVPHRAVVRLVRNQDDVTLGPDERVLGFAPLAFDASTFEVWGPLLNGGALVLAPPGPLSPTELDDVVRAGGVTTLWLTAGLFHQVVDACPALFRRVRQVLAGGDVLSPSHVNTVLGLLPPGGAVVNGYGPTEGTTFTCFHRMPAATVVTGGVPIGRPLANTRVYILDEDGSPVPEGIAGELYAAGDGVALGYVGRPDLTAERFLPDPTSPDPDVRMYRTGDLVRRRRGLIEFIGRLDDQVKIRGFRVEPAEVEHTLGTVAGVRDAAVVVQRDDLGEPDLAAFVVLDRGSASLDDVRGAVAERLPAHLVPRRWTELDALPLGPNGKVDRRALPAAGSRRMEEDRAEPAPGRALTVLEQRLVEIWQDVLGVRPVHVDDDFFELGGHSLRAVELFAAIERIIGPRLPLATIFEASTVAELALRVRAEGWEAPWSSLVPLRSTGRGLPFFCLSAGDGNTVGYGALARRVRDDQRFYALQPRGLDGRRALLTSVEAMAEHYLLEVRGVQPRGPYLLGGRCLGGLVAYEMARRLEVRGESVALLAVLDSLGPRWSERRLPNGLPYDEVMNLARLAAAREGVALGDIFSADGAARFVEWLREPVVAGEVVVNRYLHQTYLARPDVQAAYPPLESGGAARLVDWAWVTGRHEMGLNVGLLPPATEAAATLVPPRAPSALLRVARRARERTVDLVDVAARGRVNALTQRRQDRLQAIAGGAATRYRADPYGGTITLLRSEEFLDDVEIARWFGVDAAAVDERIVDGTHRSMLREPDVASLAACLQQCIDEATDG